jgi:hypothetical protein
VKVGERAKKTLINDIVTNGKNAKDFLERHKWEFL